MTEPRREGPGRRRARSSSAVMAEQVAHRVRDAGRKATAPRNRSRLVVLIGLAVILLVAALGTYILLPRGSGNQVPPVAAGTPTATPTPTPLIPAVQEFRERGIALNVPKGWVRTASGSYVDYTEEGANRKVRINIESTSATPHKFLQAAESGLKSPSRCPSPYAQVALRDEVKLGGKPAAQLEYTCGSDDKKRHGIWQATVVDGKAYHFYLTVPDAQFAASKVIFDEMVRSFSFTG